MKEYSVVAVLWQDHWGATRTALPVNPEEVLLPTLTVGLLVQETETLIIVVSDIERYDDRDDVTYTAIVKKAICGKVKTFGKLKIRKIRR